MALRVTIATRLSLALSLMERVANSLPVDFVAPFLLSSLASLIACLSLSSLTGFTLFVREESGAWKEISVSSDQRSYLLQDLLCGTKYQIYITAHNEAGSGLPSNTIATRTHGTGSTAAALAFP